ncbi:hypothetical protein B9Z55_015966 [Caenorhabditis nigoni]|uniref:Uncharacterized protein n=1 Tax=Caenorhabditis nigoni TaxID=1611254 RepID=A0A2G5UCN9_9PELO|nr:hypothetical protein B9Z55_015966 [Caenorhabditis nigoni]
MKPVRQTRRRREDTSKTSNCEERSRERGTVGAWQRAKRLAVRLRVFPLSTAARVEGETHAGGAGRDANTLTTHCGSKRDSTETRCSF